MNRSAVSADSDQHNLYTIGTVSKLTGVAVITLRAWERRYGLIEPVRKDSGHRLYTQAQIDRINRITALTEQGIRISQIRPEMLGEPATAAAEPDRWLEYRAGMLAAVGAFDEERLEQLYNEALSLHPIGVVTSRLLMPLLVELGQRWQGGAPLGVAEEHFFAFYLRNKLGARFHHRPRRPTGALLLLAGLPGEQHEIGLLLFGLAAHDAGFRLLTLGTNMPLQELAAVARRSRCAALVLAGAIEPAAATLREDLAQLVAAAPVPVLVGGLSSVRACDAIARSGAIALGSDIDHGLRRLQELLSPAAAE